ncbi:MAG: YeeE/YedE thiosulfate transporter family protein [Pseudomonadota bacterium]
MSKPDYAEGYWNPFIAGIALGLVLLLTFFIMGNGLGASGAVARTAAAISHAVDPQAVEQNQYFRNFYKPGASGIFVDWIVFEVIGAFFGGLVAVLTARRFKLSVGKGKSFPVSLSLVLAFFGGILGGIGTRFAIGCTSGQALSGGATMALGSWVFMMTVFATAFVAAYFVRKEWQ